MRTLSRQASALDAYPLQAGVCPGCVPSPGRRLPWIRTLFRHSSALDAHPLQAGVCPGCVPSPGRRVCPGCVPSPGRRVCPGCVPSPGRRLLWMRTLSRQASALDAYPLQAGAAYLIREITIASNTTLKALKQALF